MPASDRTADDLIREAAYFIWEREGRPSGRALEHWMRATTEAQAPADGRDNEPMDDEEKVLAGRPDANLPALLTKDVLGG